MGVRPRAASGDVVDDRWGTGRQLGIWSDARHCAGVLFREPHGIFIDSDDNIWLSEKQRHIVTKHNQSGEILMELGERDWASVTVTWDGRHGDPFNSPTGIAVAPER